MSDAKLEVPHAVFVAIAEEAERLLGAEHPCTHAFAEARTSGDPKGVERAMSALDLVPAMYREHIKAAALKRLGDEARFMHWLTAKAGLPTDVSPTETKH